MVWLEAALVHGAVAVVQRTLSSNSPPAIVICEQYAPCRFGGKAFFKLQHRTGGFFE